MTENATPALPTDDAWVASRDANVPDDVARILATLPEWFGIPSATAEYVDAARRLETWTVRSGEREGNVVGVLLVERHFLHAAEVHLMAVQRDHRGRGVGRALLAGLEAELPRDGVRLLQVKTLGLAHPDPGYAQTRRFYERAGFLALEETELWGPDTPCLIMLKPIVAGSPA